MTTTTNEPIDIIHLPYFHLSIRFLFFFVFMNILITHCVLFSSSLRTCTGREIWKPYRNELAHLYRRREKLSEKLFFRPSGCCCWSAICNPNSCAGLTLTRMHYNDLLLWGGESSSTSENKKSDFRPENGTPSSTGFCTISLSRSNFLFSSSNYSTD